MGWHIICNREIPPRIAPNLLQRTCIDHAHAISIVSATRISTPDCLGTKPFILALTSTKSLIFNNILLKNIKLILYYKNRARF